jgi:hypothetical protein
MSIIKNRGYGFKTEKNRFFYSFIPFELNINRETEMYQYPGQ